MSQHITDFLLDINVSKEKELLLIIVNLTDPKRNSY